MKVVCPLGLFFFRFSPLRDTCQCTFVAILASLGGAKCVLTQIVSSIVCLFSAKSCFMFVAYNSIQGMRLLYVQMVQCIPCAV